MVPIVLDPSRLRLGVAGHGLAADRRMALLRAAGARPLALTADLGLLPALDVLWIVDLPLSHAGRLAATARAQGTLVNIEDRPALSDFRNAAELRRGDLLISVSTNGQSPGLAGAIRDRIGGLFGTEWAERVADLGARRRAWRAEGRALAEVARLSAEAIARSGWLA
ncbi:MAG: precorrin-2 dehydrogenase/sirohydrochlorin ferrochelatase family protein [Acetobacteraceae bacterium]